MGGGRKERRGNETPGNSLTRCPMPRSPKSHHERDGGGLLRGGGSRALCGRPCSDFVDAKRQSNLRSEMGCPSTTSFTSEASFCSPVFLSV